MLNCLFVGVGGFLGAVARYLCTRLPLAPEGVLSGGTFSKVLFPSVRLGYLVAPRQLVASLCAQKRLSDHHTNSLDQLALAAFLRDGELERHTRRMKKMQGPPRPADGLPACAVRACGTHQRRCCGHEPGCGL